MDTNKDIAEAAVTALVEKNIRLCPKYWKPGKPLEYLGEDRLYYSFPTMAWKSATSRPQNARKWCRVGQSGWALWIDQYAWVKGCNTDVPPLALSSRISCTEGRGRGAHLRKDARFLPEVRLPAAGSIAVDCRRKSRGETARFPGKGTAPRVLAFRFSPVHSRRGCEQKREVRAIALGARASRPRCPMGKTPLWAFLPPSCGFSRAGRPRPQLCLSTTKDRMTCLY